MGQGQREWDCCVIEDKAARWRVDLLGNEERKKRAPWTPWCVPSSPPPFLSLSFSQVREEQERLRGKDFSAHITGEVLSEMKYTRQVVKEILRFRPAAPMVPQVAMKPFKMTEDYTAPKGTMIVPSCWASCMQVGTRRRGEEGKGREEMSGLNWEQRMEGEEGDLCLSGKHLCESPAFTLPILRPLTSLPATFCVTPPPQGYENPYTFDPERFSPERGEDVKFAQNFMVFGHGPHYCVGKEYAQNHLATFLARIATSLDIKRIHSKVRKGQGEGEGAQGPGGRERDRPL